VTAPSAQEVRDIQHHAALDQRLVAAVKGIRLLESVSWPAAKQEQFLAGWRIGKLVMPKIEYQKQDMSGIRAELEAVDAASDKNHPIGRYLHLTCESWRIATRLSPIASPRFQRACSAGRWKCCPAMAPPIWKPRAILSTWPTSSTRN